VTVGNADLELEAWRAFVNIHRAFVLLEPSESTDAKVGEKFCAMWASLLLVAAGSVFGLCRYQIAVYKSFGQCLVCRR